LFLSAQLLGSAGVWMLRMAADWLVLKLTGSPAAVGALVALQFLPLLLVGPLGGVIADRHDKRRLVLVSQAAAAVVAGTLAVLTLTHQVAVWHLCAIAVALGLIAGIEMPARQVLVNEVLGDASLQSAIGMSNALNQGGGLIGPALAGLVIARVGQGWAFGVNALVCLAEGLGVRVGLALTGALALAATAAVGPVLVVKGLAATLRAGLRAKRECPRWPDASGIRSKGYTAPGPHVLVPVVRRAVDLHGGSHVTGTERALDEGQSSP
jgi:MFS family permease